MTVRECLEFAAKLKLPGTYDSKIARVDILINDLKLSKCANVRIGGPLVIANDPALIRHVLVDNSKNYKMATVRQKILRPILRDGLLERVKAEGARSPADLLMTADSGQLIDLVLGGVTQGVKSKPLESAIPPQGMADLIAFLRGPSR